MQTTLILVGELILLILSVSREYIVVSANANASHSCENPRDYAYGKCVGGRGASSLIALINLSM